MSKTFRARLFGDRLEWEGEPPDSSESPLQVQITVMDISQPETAKLRHQAMVQALKQLAQISALGDITDPVIWQRSIRQDRYLPGRET